MLRCGEALGDRQPEVLPHLLLVEAVAHVVAGLDHELLALVALGVGQLRVVLAQGEPAERDVARLVLHDVGVDRGAQRVRRQIAEPLEGGERQPLDEDLHAEVGHVPAPVADRGLEQLGSAGVIG